jgi:hypothetical protein
VRSSRRWTYALLCALAVTATPGCNRRVDALQRDDENIAREEIYLRQLDLDMAAIIRGMARAHGAQEMASAKAVAGLSHQSLKLVGVSHS